MKWIRRNPEVVFIPLLYVALYIAQRTGFFNNYIMQIVMLACINICMTLSLNLVNGITGQSSIGHA